MRICSPSVPRLKHEWNHTVGLIINLRCGTAVGLQDGPRDFLGAPLGPFRSDWKSFGPIGQISVQAQSRTDHFHAGFGCVSGVKTIELDIHSHSALACPRRLLGSSPNTFWGQVSFKLEKLEKILKKGENRHEERNSKATCSHTGNS